MPTPTPEATPEATLEAMVLRQVADIKCSYDCWADPEALALALQVQVARGRLGPQREGAAFDDAIVVDAAIGTPGRQRFTWYHELTQQLLRRNDEVYAILHDQYPNEDDFIQIRERLANVGAAEFLLPREEVRAMVTEHSYSLRCVDDLSAATGASRTAVLVQLVRCAGHRCLGVVCHWRVPDQSTSVPLLSASEAHVRPVLRVAIGSSSPAMRYAVARGHAIPTGHLLYDTTLAQDGQVVSGRAAIPFRYSRREWVVECEALRLGEQILALFHADPPPVVHAQQLTLF